MATVTVTVTRRRDGSLESESAGDSESGPPERLPTAVPQPERRTVQSTQAGTAHWQMTQPGDSEYSGPGPGPSHWALPRRGGGGGGSSAAGPGRAGPEDRPSP